MASGRGNLSAMRRVCAILGLLAMLALGIACFCADPVIPWQYQRPTDERTEARPVDWGWTGVPGDDARAMPYPYGTRAPFSEHREPGPGFL